MSILHTLRASAVASSVFLVLSCGGTDVPKTSLVRIDDEPAGANCPNGGLAIVSGIDGNTNGVLDANEEIAAQTRYVCNPPPPAPPAGAVLTAIDTTVSAADCPYGGDRVRSGRDTNGNGVLDDTEVTSTSFACNPRSIEVVHFGDVTIASADDVSTLDGIEIITGALSVTLQDNVALPKITLVGNGITIGVGTPSGVDNVLSMPALTQAASLAFTSGTIDAPQLRTVSGTIGYPQGAFPFPGPIAGPTLSISLPALEHASSISFSGSVFPILTACPITTLSLPALQTTTSLTYSCPTLATVDLSVLQHADTFVIAAGTLTSLSLPAFTSAGTFQVSNLPSLTSLTVPQLQSIASGLMITNDPNLDGCAAVALEVSTIPAGRHYVPSISGLASTCTNSAATCGALSIGGAQSSFHVCMGPVTETDGESVCDSLFGGHAASFASADEESAVKGVLPFDAWIGFTDAAAEGTWVWTDGSTDYVPTTSDTTFWAITEPNGSTGENCAQMQAGGAADFDCTTLAPVLCRAP